MSDSVLACKELMSIPEVAQTLGERAVRLAWYADGLYVPNVLSDVVMFPLGDIDNSATPCVPLDPQERLVHGGEIFRYNSYQEDRISRENNARDIRAFSHDKFTYEASLCGLVGRPLRCPNLASVGYSIPSYTPLFTPIVMHTTPFMTFSMDAGRQKDTRLDRGVTMLHELLHVHYRNERPFVSGQYLTQNLTEQEAATYAVAAQALIAAGVDPQNAYRLTDVQKFTFRMDTLRSKHTSPDRPYEATDALVAQYISEGAVIRIDYGFRTEE